MKQHPAYSWITPVAMPPAEQTPANDAEETRISNTVTTPLQVPEIPAPEIPAPGIRVPRRRTRSRPPPGHRLALTRLPASARQAQDEALALRRKLERAVVAAHGQVSLTQAAAISTAARWEATSRIAAHWLSERADTMSDECRLSYLREIARASAERDRSIARLALPVDKILTAADILYGPRPITHDAVTRRPAAPGELPAAPPSNASTGQLGGTP